ncbi:acetyl/propionyl/methylcrotonyl-CoA carboxylase subunit alpha [Williamsia sp.]|uniref:acetyl-CoA carboxylase biotin carboxylase subunit n=1 Tax=Williamsia sp. TaxID=1872085 RepID=UPI001A265C89|nr:acetyl/propionyl/methylcrotonyl-CoA carboxylase subunit alpha [Williamsia sp.]MBJ7291016.1 acetyl/propionyl/methylcrotonyl-CoA carboxylase subunit alpha [Williamsia sp.]
MSVDSVLVANRGEIAVRVIRTLRDMGIRSIAVFSEADADAPHVHAADDAILIGPAPARESYLKIDAIIAAATRTGADAIHPGYGFLSENADFASACDKAGIVFIGPTPDAMTVMGDKITAKNTVSGHGVPVVPGIARPGLTDDELIDAAGDIGYPVLVKPSAGGGGKGMRVVHQPSDLAAALVSARREAASSFGDDTLFLERFVLRPRHIEVQVLADTHGGVIHLGERECSLQRRHQKVIEEAPSPLLDETTRARIGAAACDTARSVGYRGAGTVEFIVSADRPDEFFFMEMNTRLQVEHPVTEMVTGIDLVQWQIRVARGEVLDIAQDDVTLTGHAIEARVYAEDPAHGFIPTGGTVLSLDEPTGTGVRVDSGIATGSVVGSNYDPMLSKVIAHGPDRATAVARLDRALEHTALLGVGTNIDFLRFLLSDKDVRNGDLDTGLLDRLVETYAATTAPDDAVIAAAVHEWSRPWSDADDLWSVPSGWRPGGVTAPTTIRLRADTGSPTPDQDTAFVVALRGTPSAATASVDDAEPVDVSATLTDDGADLTVSGRRRHYRVVSDDEIIWVHRPGGVWRFARHTGPGTTGAADASADTDIRSPMPGSVIAVGADDGAAVTAGTVVLVVEAMKMEHSLTASVDGTVELLVGAGDQVGVGDVLARIIPTETTPVNDDPAVKEIP